METSTNSSSMLGDTGLPIMRFVQSDLPSLNARVALRQSCPFELAAHVRSVITNDLLIYINQNDVPHSIAVSLLMLLGFCVSSIERHLQTFGIQKTAFELLPVGVESAMLKLSQITGLPPRDSSYTTWLLNDLNNPLTFDNNEGWKYFHKAVCLTNQQNLFAIGALSEICKGNVDIETEDAVDFINVATNSIIRIKDYYAAFPKKSADGQFMNLCPAYFMDEYRTYFLPYRIGEKIWGGTNAANIASCAAIDFRIGLIDESYINTVKERYEFYTPSDQNYIDKQIAMPSLLDVFVERSKGDISMELRKSFKAYTELVTASGRLTRVHFGLIDKYLVKQSEAVTKCPLGHGNQPAVSPLQGTGGATHEDTKRIRDMRLYNPVFEQLSIKLVA